VFSFDPVKLPDGAALVVVFDAVGVGELAWAGAAVAAGAVVGAVTAGAALVAVADDDAFGAAFFAGDLDGDALAEAFAASEPPFGEVIGDAVTVGVTGDVLATATPATCVLYENSAARPATVVPRTATARRIKPPGRNG
jgi:hypothetical protein